MCLLLSYSKYHPSDEKPCKVQRHGYGHTPARSQLAAEVELMFR